jgi:Flp pilus assembly secretin CpaC
MNYAQTVAGSRVTGLPVSSTLYSVIVVSITTTGNPVQITTYGDVNCTGGAFNGQLRIYRDGSGTSGNEYTAGTALGNAVFYESSGGNENQAFALAVIDTTVTAGTHTYTLVSVNRSGPSTFDFGESQGLGRILARPELRTKPGIAANFQSGGEIPVKTRGLFGNTTIWKPYGLILNLTPLPTQKVGATEVSLDFKVEISEPDQSTAIDGVPGMIIRKLESRFDLRTDEDTLLSSMIQTRSGTMKSGIAGLFHVPLLGDLTSNHSNDEQQTELWFSIRPTWFDSTKTARIDQTL